jgi:hypothetical protein
MNWHFDEKGIYRFEVGLAEMASSSSPPGGQRP